MNTRTSGRRIEAFSDGVFAIAITLLVVELPFAHARPGHLDAALADHWASFAAYAVSFLTIGIAWMHHHAARRLHRGAEGCRGGHGRVLGLVDPRHDLDDRDLDLRLPP